MVVVKFYYGADATDHEKYWGTQFPQVLFQVRGLKVYDPRDASQSLSDATTWKWSNTPSLCQAHYMTFSKGMSRPWSTIDLATLKTAADNDDRRIALASGTLEKRYSLDGIVNPNEPSGNVIQNMLTANLGKIIWSNGVYKFLSGVARTPVWTLNDDSARGDMQVRVHRDRAGLLNVVRIIFVSLDREYQTVNGPVLSNATYITADGESHEGTITLPFTNSQTTAQRIARITMEHARKGKQISRREDINALRLESADIVNIEVPHLPVLGGVFELSKINLDHENFEIEIECEEYNTAMFDWLVAYEQPFIIAPVDLAGVN